MRIISFVTMVTSTLGIAIGKEYFVAKLLGAVGYAKVFFYDGLYAISGII
jgi:hypothetical protein